MGQLTIPDNATVYVDTAPVIYSVELHPDYWTILQPLWVKQQAQKISLISSELLWMETLVFPLKTKNRPLTQLYEELLRNDIQIIAIDKTILSAAAEIRATTHLKTPDAIHIATALNIGCNLFLTDDAGLRNVLGLTVVVLKDVLEA
jgi:predicted nucleic acid-binding protein